ncbi:twitching motility protein [Thermodesulfobium narugense DSM 14796]|uniref:Twitching motility protein n=1 Tax=Thermodesulfobium narugense DSM 14796 TaxID=747365 RepID=M1E4B5_9BACT|nr:type IV pilus twitching motility protein PilT [Thermodesulfobium narugense]AEE13952.1 twitching motility protein [Thermodesulfobium narugense DSM 14796]
MEITELLEKATQMNASDIHISVGIPPVIRREGKLIRLEEYGNITPKIAFELIFSMLSDYQKKKIEEELDIDFSYGISGVGRFRVNVFKQRGVWGAALRLIPWDIPSLETLGLPPIIAEFAKLVRGLVLVTGPTGSGKSTTLASLVNIINRTRECHIITIEDPIEYLHSHKKSIVDQREVGNDTKSFARAVRASLREDPDVILVGEMRDLETIAAAITAAETGHLVFSTLHTNDAPQTIDRIIDVFPTNQQQQIRTQLSTALQGVVSQALLPKIGGGRVVATEVMIATPAVRNLIREGKTSQLYSVIQTSGRYGMQQLDSSLKDLVLRGKVSFEDAFTVAVNKEEFMRLVGRL